MNKVIIIMGSRADLDWAKHITMVLDGFGIENITRMELNQKLQTLNC